MIYDIVNNVRKKRPLIHNITNYVTATDCANITLTVGASPIMADDPLETYEVASVSDGLVLNTGTISEKRIEAMLSAGNAANKKHIPIILDPVGMGISNLRKRAVTSILAKVKPNVIRLNYSELKSMVNDETNVHGVDSADCDSTQNVITLAKKLSQKTGAVVGVSGVSDVITDGDKTAVIKSGHKMMKLITGSGCMLSSVIGAYCGGNHDNLFNAAVAAFAVYGICGKRAYRENIGTLSYKISLFDEMTNPNLEGIEIEYR